MTNYSERSLHLAAELRRQALQNLEQTKQTASEKDRQSKRSAARKFEKDR